MSRSSAPNPDSGHPVDLATWHPDWDTEPLSEFPVYTRANIGEVIPGIISPLGATAGANMLDAGFILLSEALGAWEPFKSLMPEEVLRGERPAYLGIFFGRPHLNLSLITQGADLVPGTSAAAAEEQYLGGVRHPGAAPRRLSALEQRVRLTIVPNFLRMLLRAPRLTREQEQLVDQYVGRESKRDLRALDADQLLALLDYSARVQRPVACLHLFNSTSASTGLETLSKTVRSWLPDAPDGLTEHLVTGLPDIESAKPAYEIWRLSRVALGSPELKSLVESTPASELAGNLAASSSHDAGAFRLEIRGFLKRYGYRAMREAELSSKSWADDPTFVFATLKSYLAAGESADPVSAHREQERLRIEAERYAFARVGLVRRPLFRLQLTMAQTFISLREKTKAQLVRVMGPGRALCREAGRRLAEGGIISAPDDVFLLVHAEFVDALHGRLDPVTARAAVERRRREIAICEQLDVPEWFEGQPSARWAAPSSLQETNPGESETVLHGIAVSPGRVRARARVITTLDEDATVEQGEILVAPYTDAAWTPLFFTAAAVVVDLGGPLSHGSTVAREYGLPAVVNVKTGTSQIRNGQEITVDGSSGEVILHR